MPQVDVHLESTIKPSFRVDQVAGLFDVSVTEKSRLDVSVHVPDSGGDWQIGAIVGPSGGGKSSVARLAYGDNLVEHFDWPQDGAIVDGFDGGVEMSAITGALNAVGFSSPPAWVLPFGCLSTGQRMRANLARALLMDQQVVAFDEFTSVVDRQVGRFASAAVSKAVRKRRVPLKRFVAVTCHYDVLDWLEPDWVLDMKDRKLIASPTPGGGGKINNADLARGWVRPGIKLQVRRISKTIWPVFEPHHYLSSNLHPSSYCYLASWDKTPVGFLATIPNAGHKGRRIVHRLVVLPDYQGMGIGLRLLDCVARYETAKPARGGGKIKMSIKTSHPALIGALSHRPGWKKKSVSLGGKPHRGFSNQEGRLIGSIGRSTVGFEYAG